ncbi:MAG: electron transfer flavoprotein subunit alpha/FixB family protein, partial [Bacteroidales bacterium]
VKNLESTLYPYGVDVIHFAQDKRLFPFTTLPHTSIIVNLFKELKPEIMLFGASSVGRDLAPRVASALKCGLTADCTSLEIGDHTETKSAKTYKNLLYQIRPAFGGNIIATIVNPETRPQMATVREGVMKKEIFQADYKGILNKLEVAKYTLPSDFVCEIIERHIEAQKVNIKGSQIIVAGGYGVGSKENFKLLYELAGVLGAEVGATRAAVDGGFIDHERQIGQTGVTVRPKLYIACGISGAVQHRAGMDQSSKIISINTDPNAPINKISDYVITGSVQEVLPKMIKYYKAHSK